MPFDRIVMREVILELQAKLTGGRNTRIHQRTKTELIFTVRNNHKNYSLLFSVHPTYARFHITEDVNENPKEPAMFCMHLRKYLSGGFIEQIEQVELERIALFKIQARDEIGDQTSKYIVLEPMG